MRGGLKFLHECRLVDVIEAPSNIGVEDLFGLLTNVEEDGCDSIVTGAERRESHSC